MQITWLGILVLAVVLIYTACIVYQISLLESAVLSKMRDAIWQGISTAFFFSREATLLLVVLLITSCLHLSYYLLRRALERSNLVGRV